MMKILIIAAAVLLTVLAMTASCGSGDLVKLTLRDGNLVDEKNGITYINAPMCFEPVSTELEPYAVCKDTKLELYGIVGCDTSLWLSEKFEGIGSVYYAEGAVELPTLESFDADSMVICVEQTITTGLGVVEDKSDVDGILDAFFKGDRTTIIPEGEVYKLKLASDEYEGIYYNLIYIEADGGKNYIYDRSNKICAEVGEALYEYLPR